MGNSKLGLVPFLIQLYLVRLTFCQPNFWDWSCIDTYGNYTHASTYKANLNSLLSSISSETRNNNGFYNISIGQDPDTVNVIALCRGDLTIQDCHKCLNNSATRLPQLCPTQRETIGCYDNCMLLYSNRSILGIYEEKPACFSKDLNTLTDPDHFNQVLNQLLTELKTRAASGNSQLKVAAGYADVSSSQTIYALVQCSPSLSSLVCSYCVNNLIGFLPSYSDNRTGARFVGPSCNIRYDTSQFYGTLPSINSSSKNTTGNGRVNASGHHSNTGRIVLIVTVSTVVSVAIVVGILFLLRTKRRITKVEMAPSYVHETEDEETRSVMSLQYSFDSIRVATNEFSDFNKIGRGGFGTVYKGRLANGQEVAVKRLSENSGQGESEFKNEVLLVAKLQHRNLVKLLGFCLQDKERLLIYEFVPNTSLDHFLFDQSKRSCLDWEKRYRIIIGIARGLLYLHEDSRLRIIHRDLKASNILLDSDMSPKIADFGMARLFGVDQTRGDTSRIVGTYGYMAPEYLLHGYFSVKSDVYSFGVLVLEIITGRKRNDFQNVEYADLLNFVWGNWREGMPLSVIDATLTTGPSTDIIRCIHIGLLCVQESVEDRPTMSSVVLMLSSHSLTLPVPSDPAFITGRGINTNSTSTESSLVRPQSMNDDSITELGPR